MSSLRQELTELSRAFRHFHSALLELNKAEYETQYGVISGPFVYYQLVLEHPHFQWLRPLSGLMATLDQVVASKTEIDAQNIRDVQRAIALLFSHLDPTFIDFRKHYSRFRLEPTVQITERHWRKALVALEKHLA